MLFYHETSVEAIKKTLNLEDYPVTLMHNLGWYEQEWLWQQMSVKVDTWILFQDRLESTVYVFGLSCLYSLNYIGQTIVQLPAVFRAQIHSCLVSFTSHRAAASLLSLWLQLSPHSWKTCWRTGSYFHSFEQMKLSLPVIPHKSQL